MIVTTSSAEIASSITPNTAIVATAVTAKMKSINQSIARSTRCCKSSIVSKHTLFLLMPLSDYVEKSCWVVLWVADHYTFYLLGSPSMCIISDYIDRKGLR